MNIIDSAFSSLHFHHKSIINSKWKCYWFLLIQLNTTILYIRQELQFCCYIYVRMHNNLIKKCSNNIVYFGTSKTLQKYFYFETDLTWKLEKYFICFKIDDFLKSFWCSKIHDFFLYFYISFSIIENCVTNDVFILLSLFRKGERMSKN